MTAGAEDLKTGKWLVAQMSEGLNGSVNGIYFGVAPSTASLPVVRYHVQGQIDVRGAARGTQRILTRIDWLIVVVYSGLAIAPLIPLVVAVDESLHEQTGETDEVYVESCVRLEPFNLLPEEVAAGKYQREAGGLYRTYVKAK